MLGRDGAEEADAAAAINSDLVVADISSDTTTEEERVTNEAMRAEATRLATELMSQATMLASQVAEAMGGVVDGWVATAIRRVNLGHLQRPA